MYTITAKDTLTQLTYLTGFYTKESEANASLLKFSENKLSYKIIELTNISDYPFFVLESNNIFMYFQNYDELMSYTHSVSFEEDEEGIYFVLYYIQKNKNDIDGQDKMGTWEHYHIDKYDYLNIKNGSFMGMIA